MDHGFHREFPQQKIQWDYRGVEAELEDTTEDFMMEGGESF